MKKSTIKSNKQNFLEEGFKGDIFKHHKKYLGTDIPEGYFEKSKSLILNKIKENIKIKGNPIFGNLSMFFVFMLLKLLFMLAFRHPH